MDARNTFAAFITSIIFWLGVTHADPSDSDRAPTTEIAINKGLLLQEQGDSYGAARAFGSVSDDNPDLVAMKDLALTDDRQHDGIGVHGQVAIGYEYVSKLILLDRPIGGADASSPFNAVTLDPDITMTIFRNSQIALGFHTVDFLTGIMETGVATITPNSSTATLARFESTGSYQGGPFVEAELSHNLHLSLAYDLQYVTIPPNIHWGATRNLWSSDLTFTGLDLGTTSLYYQFALESYTSFFDKLLQPEPMAYSLGGSRHTAGVTQTVSFPKLFPGRHKGAELQFGAQFQRQQAKERSFVADFVGPSVALSIPIAERIALDLGARYMYEFYEQPSAVENSHNRIDWEAGASVGIEYHISDNVALDLEYDYLKHSSNTNLVYNFAEFNAYRYSTFAFLINVIYKF